MTFLPWDLSAETMAGVAPNISMSMMLTGAAGWTATLVSGMPLSTIWNGSPTAGCQRLLPLLAVLPVLVVGAVELAAGALLDVLLLLARTVEDELEEVVDVVGSVRKGVSPSFSDQ